MKLGIYSYFGYALNPDYKFKIIKEQGFDYTSIWWGDEYIEQHGDKEKSVEIAQKADLIVENLHAPIQYANNIWTDDINLPDILDSYKKCILACKKYEIPTMVLHLSSGATPPPYNSKGVDNMRGLVELAEKENINIALENTRSSTYIYNIFNDITSDKLKTCYDSGHDNCFGATKILEKFPQKLVALHLHDNDGISDQHILPFDGTLNWTDVISRIKNTDYSGVISLEVAQINTDKYKEYSEIDFLEAAFKKTLTIANIMQAGRNI